MVSMWGLCDGLTIAQSLWPSMCSSIQPLLHVERYDKNRNNQLQCFVFRLIRQCNQNMGGVDALVSYYRIKLKSKAYYLRFFHFVDLAVVNGWLLYRRACDFYGITYSKQNDSLTFKSKLAESLCKVGKDMLPTKKLKRPSLDSQCSHASRVRIPCARRPLEEIRKDKIGHWSDVVATRQRCKNCKL